MSTLSNRRERYVGSDPIEVMHYKCPYCDEEGPDEHAIYEHVMDCQYNPDREPELGEITWLGAAVCDWWPGTGLIYTQRGWETIKGCLKDSNGNEFWPWVRVETKPGVFGVFPLQEMPPHERLAWHEGRVVKRFNDAEEAKPE